jgi:hypothetical protein
VTEVSTSSHARARRRGLTALAAAAGTAGLMSVAGCGIQPTALKVVGSAPTLQAADDVAGSAGTGSGTNQYELYFFRNGRLSPVVRYTNQTVGPDLVFSALIKGPDPTDQSEGFSSVIPQNLSVVSDIARDQEWNYEYSQDLTLAEKAEIVCTVQADLGAPSVGTSSADGNQVWNNCNDFTDDYGAPAALATDGSAFPSPSYTAQQSGN